MKVAQRIAWYLGGFGIGLLILFFFLGGKKTSCDYGPNDRVLKNIRIKDRVLSEAALVSLKSKQLDTSAISTLLYDGTVDFGESITNLDSCNVYIINGEVSEKKLQLKIQNCTNRATVLSLKEVTN
ncbi:hypothetical protein ACFQO1_06210 [Jejudonia soesokkakensis]|uniref:DUF4258 domain-containing protein n=1 Tax=Jejudonia soesokkakensis TaxID=1323432 RepID=A0ABW2MUR9_9FLAO